MSRIVIMNGAEAGKTLELAAPEIVIGRQSGLEVQLGGQKVSRRHARILREGERFRLEDLRSSNGTFLNGARVSAPLLLRNRDEIGIGSYLLRYECEDGHASPELTIHARTAASTANAELYRNNAAQKLQIIMRLSADLGRSLEVNDLLQQALEHLMVLFPQAERGLVILLEESRPVVRAQKQRSSLPPGALFSSSVVQRVAGEGVGICAEDPQIDSRFAEAQSIISLGVRSFICVPLPAKSGKAMGVLQLERMGAGHKFTPEDLNLLTALGLQVSVALENAQLHQELLARQRIENEVALAREIQLGYLPTAPPDLPEKDFEVYADLVPANEISGDFYDYFTVGGNRLALAVADVCGKGIPAAIFMSMVRALLRDYSQRQTDPGIVLRELNNAVTEQNPKCQFVTISFGVFDPRTKAVEIASAGHPPPLLRRSHGAVEVLDVAQGPLLGYLERKEPYFTTRLELRAQDLLLLYTDGITEAATPQAAMFGTERLREALAVSPFPARLRDWTESLRARIQGFTGSRHLEDDVTLMLLRAR